PDSQQQTRSSKDFNKRPMKISLWQLLPLLLSMRVAASLDCSAANRTVTVQLSRADVLRTWQPSGAHCRWWESRSVRDKPFPCCCAVRASVACDAAEAADDAGG
uniref:Secreted protein n=1 Tax=Macrostomum lignano TaxID=282301 RepID=A0A1I8J3S9_9PLAT